LFGNLTGDSLLAYNRQKDKGHAQMPLALLEVQDRAWEAYELFKEICQSLRTNQGSVVHNGNEVAYIGFSQQNGIDFLYNCGISPHTMEAKDTDNLIQWWNNMFPTYAQQGQAALPPAQNNRQQWEIHLFGYRHKAKPQPGEWWSYRFNFHVPLEGHVAGPVQLKGHQKSAIRSGKASYAAMGLKFVAKKT
jgi:hypothetical protein